MLQDRIVANYFATNCWFIAPGIGSECIVVDPGIGSPSLMGAIKGKLAQLKLKPVAVLITHGHLDHTFSLLPLTEDCGAQVLVHNQDRDLLSKPERGMGPQGLALMQELSRQFGTPHFEEPKEVYEVTDGTRLNVAGMNIEILHTPGHTPGSLVATIEDEFVVTGDTLFAGAIGRTDLPRGSISDMERSLREKIASLPGHLLVLPGHGERTRMDIELASNPYLLAALEGRLM